MKRRRCYLYKISLAVLALFFINITGLMASVFDIPELYSRDPGTYRPGVFGQGLALIIEADGPLYPVVFANREVKKCTLSIRFRPLRQLWMYEWQNFLILSDGKNSVNFLIHAGSPVSEKPPRYIQVSVKKENQSPSTCFSKQMDKNAHEKFHHLVYTWNNEKGQIYLDGEIVATITDTKILPGNLDGRNTTVRITAPNGIILDELVVLEEGPDSADVKTLVAGSNAWQPTNSTRLYVPFDGNLTGKTAITNYGDNISFFARPGRPEAIFLAQEKIEIPFYIINHTDKDAQLTLEGTVNNLKRKSVLEKKYPVSVPAGGISTVMFDMNSIKEKGLFWGTFKLKESTGKILHEQYIKFAATLGIDPAKIPPENTPNGLVVSQGFNPAPYEKWMRFELFSPWRNLEYEPGKWDFEVLDILIDSAIRNGREPTLMLVGPPDWQVKRFPVDKYPDYNKRTWACPEDISAYKDYVRRLGERYKGKVYHYEVWNEPYWNDPAGGYFYGPSQQYAELVRASYETLKKVDPSIQICSGMGGSQKWQQDVAKDTAGYADYYGMHLYPFAELQTAWKYSRIIDENLILQTMEILKQAGASTSLANTEISDSTLMQFGVDEQGYPMTAEEFDASGKWETVIPLMKEYGRPTFHDYFTSAAALIRARVLSDAVGCKYFLWWSNQGGAFGSLKYAAYIPTLDTVAYTNIIGILSGYRFVKRIDLGANYLFAYLYYNNIKNDYVVVAWTYKNPETVYMEAGSGHNIEVIDIYGNPVAAQKTGPLLSLPLSFTPVYVRGFSSVPAGSRPIMRTLVDPAFVYPGQPCRVKVEMYNSLEEVLSGTLNIEVPEGFQTPSAITLSLQSRETSEYTFEISVPSGLLGTKQINVIFLPATGAINRLSQKTQINIKQYTTAARIKSGYKADGDLSEWEDTKNFPVKINSPEQVVIGVPYTEVLRDEKIVSDWKGSEDLSGMAVVYYDEKNLYVKVRVYDNEVHNPVAWKYPPRAYDGDCVEIWIDARPAEQQGKKDYTENVYHLMIVPVLDDYPAPMFHISSPAGGKLAGVVVNSKRLKDGYTVSITLPFSNFPSLKPTPGTTFGFDIGINDADKDNSYRKVQMLWAGGVDNSKDASLFGKLILGE
ncbi:MAG: hypothetical protein N3D17_06010 [bacterium]|nr:hypothetical protein [bacterium]